MVRSPLVMRDPGAVERLRESAVAPRYGIGRDRADKGVERLRADRVDDALADRLRIETGRREALGQHRLVARARQGAAHMLRAVAGAARDIRVVWTGTHHRDTHLGAVALVVEWLGSGTSGGIRLRIRPMIG